jgi:putative ABC transport system ATP-binding protein
MPNSENRARLNIYKLQVRQLNKKIEYLKTKIKDVRSSFWNRYFSKLVRKLEKVKKDTSIQKVDGVIDLEHVCKYYANKSIATKILKDVNLRIASGEFVVIVGPSGSGKTTLLNIISGMDRATYGKVLVAGESLINLSNAKLTDFRRRNIGYVFQQYALLPNLTVQENIEIGQHLQKEKAKRINIDKLLHSLDMYEHRNKFPHELSGGQQQRVSIARSMAKNPNIIFGDEPTGAVDEATSKNILDMFIKLNKEYGTTVVIVTHNKELTKLATTLVNVNDGNVYQQKIQR